MVVGFNHNVMYRGDVFHIQTEDSGVKHPHIITHLFADGGRILKSVKTSYAEHLSQENLTDTVRTMMKDQHKAMFIALRDGTFDTLIDEGLADAARSASTTAQPRVVMPSSSGLQAPPRAARPSATDLTPPVSVRADPEAAQAWVGAPADKNAPAAQPAHRGSIGQAELPPPPAAVLAPKRATGAYRGPTPDAPSPGSAARYAASRPAAIFASARPAEGRNVFGEEMISDKSLDEVILSFLAEEFGTNPGDKSGSGGR